MHCCRLRPSAAAGCSSPTAGRCTAAAHPAHCCSAGPAGSPARCRRWYRCPAPDCTAWGWHCSVHRSAAGTPAAPHLRHSWSRSLRSVLPPVPQHPHWRCGRSADSSARTDGRAGLWCSCTGSSRAAAAGPEADRSCPDSGSRSRRGGSSAIPSGHSLHSSPSDWAYSWHLPVHFPPPRGCPVPQPNNRSAPPTDHFPPSVPAPQQALRPVSFCLP